MHVSALKQSKFLTRADVGRGMLVTIKGDIFEENVAKEGAPPENRFCLEFEESEKPFVCNSTNGQLIAQITKSEETSTWAGHKVVLYDDPTVSFGGKLVGGIRVRAPRGVAARPAPAAAGTGINNPALRAAAAAPVVAPPVVTPEPEPWPVEEGAGDPDVPF